MHWFQHNPTLGIAMILIINCRYKIGSIFTSLNSQQCKAIIDHINLLERRVKEQNEKIAALKEMAEDHKKAIKMLDDAGVWTGADDLVHDRVYQVIQDRDYWKRQAGAK